MLRKFETKMFIPCNLSEKTIRDCKYCVFFNGIVKDEDSEEIKGVDCLKKEIPHLNNIHVTEFVWGKYKYSSRMYDEKIDGPLNKDYDDYCEKCCFSKKLLNGEEICMLRFSVSEEEPNHFPMFTCYDGEIWEKQNKNQPENPPD